MHLHHLRGGHGRRRPVDHKGNAQEGEESFHDVMMYMTSIGARTLLIADRGGKLLVRWLVVIPAWPTDVVLRFHAFCLAHCNSEGFRRGQLWVPVRGAFEPRHRTEPSEVLP